MEPRVSLIIPTTGERESFVTALRSALAQDLPALEIIVVDDAARGAEWRHQEPVAGLLADPRVRVVSFARQAGCALAKNAGWAAARGEWLCYLDDDNEYSPDKVRRQLECAEQTGATLVLCGMEYRAGLRRRLRQTAAVTYTGDARLLAALPDTNVLFHRRLATVRWDVDLHTAEDTCLFQALLQEAGPRAIVVNVPLPLVVYNSHTGLRANRHRLHHYRGLRRLLVRWSRPYSRAARRVLAARIQVSDERFKSGNWLALIRRARRLLAAGGWREWRLVANAAGAKLPLVKRWMVS